MENMPGARCLACSLMQSLFMLSNSKVRCKYPLHFEFPYFAIHSAKRFPSQSDENTLHIKML